MNNSNVIYPYRQNVGIMKKFFSKPIVLLLAVANCLFIVTTTVTSFVFDSAHLGLSIFVYPIINAIAFFLFYFNAKSNKPVVSFNVSIILLKILQIITIVLNGTGIIAFLGILFFAIIPATSSIIPISYMGVMSFLAIAVVVQLLQSISMLVLLCSFKKSTSSVYLYKKGAVFTAVATIFLIFASAASIYVSIMYLPEATSQFYATLQEAFPSSVHHTLSSEKNICITNIVIYVFEFILYILTIIFAFSYNRYISKLSNSYNGSVPAPVERSVPNIPTAPQNIQNGVQNIKQPVNFNPQPVFKNDNQVPPQNSAPVNQNENPYVALWNDATTKNICPGCGFECPDGTHFCGNCGAKIK